jgi:DNA-binding CsgD family transcriptional regulator
VRGESFLPGVVSALARSYLDRIRRREALPNTVLTSKEDEVVMLMAEGHSSKEIAQRLTISIKTVERHRSLVLICQSSRVKTGLLISETVCSRAPAPVSPPLQLVIGWSGRAR